MTARQIAAHVARRHNLTIEDLMGSKRHPHLLRARQELYLELRELGWSYPAIGQFVGKHHTTILGAVRSRKTLAKRA